MLQQVIPTGQGLIGQSISFDTTRNQVWAATVGGNVIAVRLLDRRVTTIGLGYRHPVSVVPEHDGLSVAVVERRGRIWWARRDYASRHQAQLVIDLPGRVLAAQRHIEPGKIVVLVTQRMPDGEPATVLHCVDLHTSAVDLLTDGLVGARTFVIDEVRRELCVLSSGATGEQSLSFVDIDTGVITPGPIVAAAFDAIVTSPDPAQHAVVGAYFDATQSGALMLQHADGSSGTPVETGRSIAGLSRWGSMLLAVSGQDVIALEWDLDEGPVAIDAPLGPLFVNGYARLPIDLTPTPLAWTDVELVVREGPEAGSVSSGIEAPRPDGSRSVMLLAGMRPGEYHLEARSRIDASILAVRRFRVTASWPDEAVGPAVAVTGPKQAHRLMSWGGGGAGPGYLLPAPDLWRVAVVLVATKEQKWGALEADAKTAWADRVVGAGDSLKRFYEEVSYRNTASSPGGPTGMTVDLAGGRVLGPVDLEEGWGDVFKPKKDGDIYGGWLSKPTGKQIIANAVSAWLADQPDGAQILELADSIVIVVLAPRPILPITIGLAPAVPAQYVWGHASHIDFWRKTGNTFTQGSKPITLMTDAYPDALPIKPIPERTLCHEIGHNLGLADLYDAYNDYPAEINSRSPSFADVMASSYQLPHFSIANRMRLGWVKPQWLRRFDFSVAPMGGTVTLRAAEQLTRAGPPAGQFAGIEVPLQDGWSYLFEMRRTQAGQIGDQQLNALSASNALVLGTDLRVSGGESARPPILFLPTDADGDGPVLDAAGEDYKDSDVTNPARMHDFGLVVQSIGAPDADSAVVRVDYVAAHRPQLQIRPAPGRGNFKSPDIEVIGPLGSAITGVIKGAANTVRITVHNRGTLAATQVQVHVKWLPFTVSAGAWKPLADPAPFDVPALGSTTITVTWMVPASVKVGSDEANHFCFRVEIDRYRDPAHPGQEEIVVFDNWAQSNFDSVSVSFGSPSERVFTVATASNALSRTATYLFDAEQSTFGYRVYLGNAWLDLPPDETRAMELGYECLADDPIAGKFFEQNLERITARPAHVAITSWLVPENTECDTPREWWGVSLDLRAGRRTWFEDVRRNGELITARVNASRDGTVMEVTHGEVHLACWPAERPDQVSVTQGLIRADGTARVLLSNQTLFDISMGSRIMAVLARPAEPFFAQAIIGPLLLD